ncbi:MAG: hypothetical protein EA360_04730 [Balneolaceae bacterium]|nr:MAG: hypothetical protein EA360_04730 [Balneolaceae bacterium]
MNKPSSDEHAGSVKRRESFDEYVLIPYQEKSGNDHQVLDLLKIIKELWIKRLQIAIVAGVVFGIGLFIYTTSDRIYYSESKLMPEATGQSQMSQLFQAADNLFGIQRRAAEEEDIRVALYPFIVESLPFQIELMQQEVYFSDIGQTVTIFDYYNYHYSPGLYVRLKQFLYDYSFGLPATIRGIFSSGTDEEVAPVDFTHFTTFDDAFVLDSRIRRVAETLRSFINITRDPQSGLVSIGVSAPDASAAAAMVNLVKNQLQEYVVEYRTEKALTNLQFIEEQFEEAKVTFQAVQDSLAEFQERNQNINRPTITVQQQRLESEFEMAFTLYNNLGRRFQEARITVQEETPVFRVHEPATVPTRPAEPKATRILAGSVFVGFFLGVALFYLRRGYRKFRVQFEKKEIDTDSSSF